MAPDPGDLARTRSFWIANKPGEPAAPPLVSQPPDWWVAAAALATALVLQSTLLPLAAFHGAVVSFVLLVVAWYGVRAGALLGFTFGLIAGAAEDALAGSTGIAWTFATAAAGLLAGRIARTWVADLPLALVPGVALLGPLRYGVFAIVMQFEGRGIGLQPAHVHIVLWQAALDAAVAFAALRFRPSLMGARAHGR